MITIVHLYPDLLNLYGDRGNIQCLLQRCLWRGVEAQTVRVCTGDALDLAHADVVLLGGGSDREQRIVCSRLLAVREELKAYVEDGGVLLAVCGGYQLLGHYYQTDAGRIEGLGLVDLVTRQKPGRLIGNVAIQSDLFKNPVVGFENHGGRTELGDGCTPLGKVIYGFGNDGQSGAEGVRYKNVIGTYLHGPLLPKNPEVCDYLLRAALRRRGQNDTLAPLNDAQENSANASVFARFSKKEKS